MNRRKALSILTAGLSACLAALYSLPFLGQVFAPLRRKSGTSASDFSVGRLSDFRPGEPTRVSFAVTLQDGWEEKISERSAWVLRTSDDAVEVFTSVCPHLGCSVAFQAATGEFECPCHHARFARDGSLAEGPAERGLDTLPVTLRAGEVRIRWVEYAAGGTERRPRGGSVS